MNIFKKDKMSLKNTISILILILVISAIIGFIYEEIFYRIDLGYFVKRGSSFTIFVPIYGWGALLLVLFTYRFKNKPWLVFLLSAVITGLFEYLSGLYLDKVMHLRLWDYNKEILNFLNINGYVCLRSILTFTFASLFLIYVMVPNIIKKYKNNDKRLRTISYILGILYFTDTILYQILK